MYGRAQYMVSRCASGTSHLNFLPQPLLAIIGEKNHLQSITQRHNVSSNTSSCLSQNSKNGRSVRYLMNHEQQQSPSSFLSPASHQFIDTATVASSSITSYQQKELTKMNEEMHHIDAPKSRKGDLIGKVVKGQMEYMVDDIHKELDVEIKSDSELSQLAKYYFDGQGKKLRPVIALTIGHAFNLHFCGLDNINERSLEFQTLQRKQRQVSIISEMIHTASLVHDDILDKADTRRGKKAVNQRWDGRRSAAAGDYIIAVASKLLAQTRNDEVVRNLAQVMADLVRGEFQQLQTIRDEEERFQLYLNKSFNKTASLMAYSCKANAILSFDYLNTANLETSLSTVAAYEYGRNLGIAFQLVDDILDFRASSSQLGKPAAADLKLGLATAPVLFASVKFPQLEPMIARRFSNPGDVEAAFTAVFESDGLERTKELATKHCKDAISAIEPLLDSEYKDSLIGLTETVLNRMN